jgi:AraC family transcriptional regulator, regulatory protein of adaptative response / DNA-3-methyladenine glycosylase II
MTIIGLARAVADKRISLHAGVDVQRTMEQLKELPGIGEWTAQYIAMRELREPDAFPAADIGLLRAMAAPDGRRPQPAELLDCAERWRPWRAYAALHLWAAGATAPEKSDAREAA